MTLDDLYPYWGDVHDELLGTLEALDAERLNFKPLPGVLTIRGFALKLLQDERFWIASLAGGYQTEMPKPAALRSGAALAEALGAQRAVTARVLEPLSAAGLRAVRTVPADALPNRPEANMPVGWLFWHLMELELGVWGQVQSRLDEARAARADEAG